MRSWKKVIVNYVNQDFCQQYSCIIKFLVNSTETTYRMCYTRSSSFFVPNFVQIGLPVLGDRVAKIQTYRLSYLYVWYIYDDSKQACNKMERKSSVSSTQNVYSVLPCGGLHFYMIKFVPLYQLYQNKTGMRAIQRYSDIGKLQ